MMKKMARYAPHFESGDELRTTAMEIARLRTGKAFARDPVLKEAAADLIARFLNSNAGCRELALEEAKETLAAEWAQRGYTADSLSTIYSLRQP